MVFSISASLRGFFIKDLSLCDLLFKAIHLTIDSIFNGIPVKKKPGVKKRKSSKLSLSSGFFSFLHTFGRDMKFNPHIHVLIAEIALYDFGFKHFNYFDYNALSKRFQKILLDLLEIHFGKDNFKVTKNKCYLNYPNSFYIHAPKRKFRNLESAIKYVTRYCGRPIIAESRIIVMTALLLLSFLMTTKMVLTMKFLYQYWNL